MLLKCIDQALVRFTGYPALQYELGRMCIDQPLHVLSIGKAAWQMAKVALNALPKELVRDVLVLTKYGFYPDQELGAELLEAGHPEPDANSIKHSLHILDWMKSIPPQEDLIVLLSGGSSALFEAPVSGIALPELISMNSLLLRSGLDIKQINDRRKELSLLKGGKAAGFFGGRNLRVYLLSDVPGNEPATIGSGPFYDEKNANSHKVIGDNQAFLQILAGQLKRRFPNHPLRLGNRIVQEDADIFGVALARYIIGGPPGIYVFGAECSLKVRGRGKGGRLSHLAMCFAREIAAGPQISLCAFATDGNDNLVQSAGAMVNQDSWAVLKEAGDPEAALADFDTYPLLNSIGAIIPGRYTGCNVNDVILVLRG